MSHIHTNHMTRWETTEKGWHAVTELNKKGNQWTAYIESANVPTWRIWAGCLFDTMELAQEWCRAEVAHQARRTSFDTRMFAYTRSEDVRDDNWLCGAIEPMHNNDFMCC